tara:strand:+ start:178 stop:897 length:720 start_codon:yes stop_codon:yes gene_type:complete
MNLIVETVDEIDYKKDVLINKTKQDIIKKFRESEKSWIAQNASLVTENNKMKNELLEMNKKFNIQTIFQNELATVEKDLNSPVNKNFNIPHDPVVMYNHSLAEKIEEDNNKIKNKINKYKVKLKEADKLIEDLSEELTIYKGGCKNCNEYRLKINIMKNDYETLYHSVKNSTATKYNEISIKYEKMKEAYEDMASRQVHMETKNLKLTKHMTKLERQCSKIRELTYSIQVLESVFDTTD